MATVQPPLLIPTRTHKTPQASVPSRRLKRFAVRGPCCPHCGGPIAAGEGARLCTVCGYLESSANDEHQVSSQSVA